jgi:hypothetical protein
MKRAVVAIGSLLVLAALSAGAADSVTYSEPVTPKYSQKALLKNWALSVCLAQVAKDTTARADANATAAAYLEYGHQPVEAYDQIRTLVDEYAARKYGGSVESEFNTMKCIDLFNSKELDRLAGKLSRAR